MRWVKRFVSDLVGAQVDGLRCAAALPLLFAAMAGLEFLQHVVEVRIGFFASESASKAVALDSSRMALGWMKMILVYAGGFLVIRYLRWGDPARATAVPRAAALRYMPYVAWSLMLFALVFYAKSFIPADRVTAFRAAVGLTQIAIEPLLMLWIVSAATDGVVRGPLESARRTGRRYWWGLALFFVGRIPANAAHQLLNSHAIGRPPSVLWPMLAVDAVVVGLLIAIVPALYVRVSRFVTAAPGQDARPEPRVTTAAA